MGGGAEKNDGAEAGGQLAAGTAGPAGASAARQGTTPDRISFLDTLRWLLTAEPGEAVPELVVNPLRPGRHEPRVRKDRNRSYPVMTKPRDVLRKALRCQKKRLK